MRVAVLVSHLEKKRQGGSKNHEEAILKIPELVICPEIST